MMQGMKRRKRRRPNRPANANDQQLAPLQPAYPEDRESAEPEHSNASDSEGAEAPVTQSHPPAQGSQKKKRRRGGRGRNKSRTGAAPAPAEIAEPSETISGDEGDATEPAAAPSPTSHAQGRQKQPKGTVVLTIGLPGSGKTSWFRRRGITPLSSDLLRMMLFDDIAEQRYQDLVFSTLRYLLRARMIARMPWNYVDATNLSPRERRGWIKMAQEFGYEVHAVFFDVPVDVCTERNQRRGRLVPEDVMQRMAQKLRPPTFEEGFTKITVVRVKKSTKTEPEPDNEVQQVDGAEPDEQF
jgi:predicted kinase